MFKLQGKATSEDKKTQTCTTNGEDRQGCITIHLSYLFMHDMLTTANIHLQNERCPVCRSKIWLMEHQPFIKDTSTQYATLSRHTRNTPTTNRRLRVQDLSHIIECMCQMLWHLVLKGPSRGSDVSKKQVRR